MDEIKLTDGELKELTRKIAAINEFVIAANTLEKDKIAYLSELLKSHGLDPKIIYNVDLKTGIITEQNKVDGSKKMNLDMDTGEITVVEDKE